MYSASVVDVATESCFRVCHDMAPLLEINTYPPCDLRFVLSFASTGVRVACNSAVAFAAEVYQVVLAVAFAAEV